MFYRNKVINKPIKFYEIDPELPPTDIKRSHRVRKLGDSRDHKHARPRQISVRLINLIVKRRILKCKKKNLNLSQNPNPSTSMCVCFIDSVVFIFHQDFTIGCPKLGNCFPFQTLSCM
jgi:hypothetical protein